MRVQDEKLVFWYRCPKYARAAPPINLWLASCRPPPSLPRSLMPLSACFIWEYRRILNLFSPHSGVTGWPAQRDRMSDEPRRCQSAVFSFQSSTSLTAPQDQRETETRENMAFKLCSIYFCQSILDDKFTASLQVSVWALLRESISRNTVKVQVNEIALRKQFLALHESRWRLTLSDVQSRINRKCQRCTNDYTLGLCNLHNAYLTKLLGCAFEKKKKNHIGLAALTSISETLPFPNNEHLFPLTVQSSWAKATGVNRGDDYYWERAKTVKRSTHLTLHKSCARTVLTS